ncbi:MICOS complex subunit MIC60 isoform X1 [Callorhinchus milii]|uniref:MICOS complex subunit MIC60 n=1 Tax=Callorhinchus milii TaxID=7868 RepID=A0A4W3IH35_CALMI|nr:MICOS complex subunit MIC60 isoform X1 [Callorhinchus milii]|eukprot:gi/632960419/ref/XP_007896185.1/ PREDICTED: mitochondrial inner membrane protein [Callorhinchus milii]
MLRIPHKAAPTLKKCLCGKWQLRPLQQCRRYTTGSTSGSLAGKIIGTGVLFVGGGIGGTMLYAKWDPKFRENVEKTVPYTDKLFNLALGPASHSLPVPKKQEAQGPLKIPTHSEAIKDSKQPKSMFSRERSEPAKEETGEESAPKDAAAIISAIGDVPSVPASALQDKSSPPVHQHSSESKSEHQMEHKPLPSAVPGESCGCDALKDQPTAVKERPPEEVAKRLTQQDREEQVKIDAIISSLEDALGKSAQLTLKAIETQDTAVQAIDAHAQRLKEAMDNSEMTIDKKSEQWRALENALTVRSKVVDGAANSLLKAKDELEKLRGLIEEAKQTQISAVRPQVLAAEENLHHMQMDLDDVVRKVQRAQSEAKIVAQYSELVSVAREEFSKELDSITPDVQPGWKNLKVSDLAGQLSTDDLNSLIAHGHRRIDQLNRELAEQRVREQQHIKVALEHQKMENQKALETAVAKALEHYQSETHLEQDKKAQEIREVMEAEMRTQLRRQAAAHTDHLREVLKVQEQEFKAVYQDEVEQKRHEYEMYYKRLNQEQMDTFTLDINAAHARLKGIEKAVESHAIAEEEARKAHQLWLSIEALKFTLKTASGDTPTEPLKNAVQSISNSCGDNPFTRALSGALPEESLSRGVYSEEALRQRFYAVRKIARRVAMIDETRNSLYQYFLSYLQSVILREPQITKPPEELNPEDLDTFKLLSYATFSIEHGDLELAAKFINQLRGEPRRVARDWLTEARLTLETKQIVDVLSAYANAVGLGTTQVE